MLAEKLPLDVLHDFLANVTDFATLYAAIRASKAFNDVFKANKKSIVRMVLENVAGPALPSAARLAEFKAGLANGHFVDLAFFPTEARYGVDWEPTRACTDILVQCGECVRILERF